jgi:hypothetical protein
MTVRGTDQAATVMDITNNSLLWGEVGRFDRTPSLLSRPCILYLAGLNFSSPVVKTNFLA